MLIKRFNKKQAVLIGNRRLQCVAVCFHQIFIPPGKQVEKIHYTYCCDDLHYWGSSVYLCKQECYSSLHVLSFLCSKPIRGFPRRSQPRTRLVINTVINPVLAVSLTASPLSISLAFIFTLIELNKKIMFDIKSFWTCGPADHGVCLFFHGKCLLCLVVSLLPSLGSAVSCDGRRGCPTSHLFPSRLLPALCALFPHVFHQSSTLYWFNSLSKPVAILLLYTLALWGRGGAFLRQ